MTLRTSYETINKEIGELDKQTSLLIGQKIELEEKKQKVINQLIKTEKLLSPINWRMIWRGTRTILEELPGADNSAPLISLINSGFCDYSFRPEDGVQINYNDGELSIYIDSASIANAFIAEYDLNVDYSTIFSRVKELEEELASIKKFI